MNIAVVFGTISIVTGTSVTTAAAAVAISRATIAIADTKNDIFEKNETDKKHDTKGDGTERGARIMHSQRDQCGH
jgi:flagellar basal body P-ring protein FlgI